MFLWSIRKIISEFSLLALLICSTELNKVYATDADNTARKEIPMSQSTSCRQNKTKESENITSCAVEKLSFCSLPLWYIIMVIKR